MYIVMVASECAPVAKVGGLADVVFGLSKELEVRGNEVEIILPKYDCMRYDHIYAFQEAYRDLWVPYFGEWVHCTVYFGFVYGRKCFFIDPHSYKNFFNRGVFYGHHDDPERFAFFSRAALEFMLRAGKHPDIIHCHDWQTGLVPVLLYEMYSHLGMTHPRVCYTIHNIRHQGVVGEYVLRETGLDRHEHFFHIDRLRDNFNPHALNLMKGGIVYSNFVTTVSPKYAWEIQTSDLSCGLGHTLHIHSAKFGGILNGIDYEVWNPEVDWHIPHKYGIENIDNKYGNKESLRERFWLRGGYKPIVSYIGRLDAQKGVHLIRHAIFYTLQNGCQFVLLGSSPDPAINNDFYQLKRHLNDNPDCHIELGYNDELSHLIFAGSDMVIIPSMYEPCGLTQMIAMRYGTVPVVRATGGLLDTVFDADHSERPYDERNGYVFWDTSARGLESALHRAVGMWYIYPKHFRELMVNGMSYDFSWNHPGEHYLNVYEYIRDK